MLASYTAATWSGYLHSPSTVKQRPFITYVPYRSIHPVTVDSRISSADIFVALNFEIKSSLAM